jgi:hypothetical protein
VLILHDEARANAGEERTVSIFWRMQLVALGMLLVWLLGTYVLDWIDVESWVYLLWTGMFMASWLIGGNVLLYWWRQDSRRKLPPG